MSFFGSDVKLLGGLAGRDVGLVWADDIGGTGLTIWGLLTAASVGLSAYHGYRRNDSVAWGIVWGLLGGVAPVISVAIAFAEGYGQRKS